MTRDESLCRARSTSTGVARRHLECNVVRDGVLCNLAQFRTRRDGVGAPVLDHVRHFSQCAAMPNGSPFGALSHNWWIFTHCDVGSAHCASGPMPNTTKTGRYLPYVFTRLILFHLITHPRVGGLLNL